MKLSVFDPNPLNELAKVFLNGVEQPNAIIADEEEGYVVIRTSLSPFIETRLTGKVEIKFTEPERTDLVVEAVRADLLARSKVGIAKYGFTLADNQGGLRYWLQHAYEETLDHANYLKRAIMELDKNGK